MPNINLLPWRKTRVLYQNRIFFAIASAAALSCAIIIVLLGLGVKFLTEREEMKIVRIREEINKLENLIIEIEQLHEQKQLLLARRGVIQALQASRPFVVKIFDNIVRAVPNGMYLNSMNRSGKQLTINGFSESNARISLFMRALQHMDWLKEAALEEIKTKSETMASSVSNVQQGTEFTLIVTLAGEY